MATVERSVVQNLLDEIGTIEEAIKAIGNTQRAILQYIRVGAARNNVLGNAAKLDAAQWSQLPDDKQNEVFERLTKIRDSLVDLLGMDGPKDPHQSIFGKPQHNYHWPDVFVLMPFTESQAHF